MSVFYTVVMDVFLVEWKGFDSMRLGTAKRKGKNEQVGACEA
jgi:hypothetical protein